MLEAAPQANVAKIESIPPGVEHRAVEVEDAVARDAVRRRNQRGESVENSGTVGVIRARQEMPEREAVVDARFIQNGLYSDMTCRGNVALVKL